MHEAVLKDIFGDDRGAFGLRRQRQVLRLAIGRESGMLFGGHVSCGERVVAHDTDRVGGDFRFDSNFVKLAEQGVEMTGVASDDVEIASGHGAGDDERAGFDAVWNDAVFGAFQFADALYANGGRARAFNFGSHFIEQVREVGDFGFAGAVLENGLAVG